MSGDTKTLNTGGQHTPSFDAGGTALNTAARTGTGTRLNEDGLGPGGVSTSGSPSKTTSS